MGVKCKIVKVLGKNAKVQSKTPELTAKTPGNGSYRCFYCAFSTVQRMFLTIRGSKSVLVRYRDVAFLCRAHDEQEQAEQDDGPAQPL